MSRRFGLQLLFLAVATCQSQTNTPATIDVAPAPSASFPANWYPADNSVTYTSAPQANAPYTATLVTSARYVDAASGQVKVSSQSTFQARDKFGRKRDEVEMARPDGKGGTIMAQEVTVSDVVSHCSFRWMEPWVAPGKPTAIVTCLPRTLHYSQQNVFADMIVQESTEVSSIDTVDRLEPLGKRMFGDLEAAGVRHTRTKTNAQPGEVSQIVSEMWYSPELQEMVEMDQIPDPNQNAAESIARFRTDQHTSR